MSGTKILVNGTGTLFKSNDTTGYHPVDCYHNDLEFCTTKCSYCYIYHNGDCVTVIDCKNSQIIPSDNFSDLRNIEKKLQKHRRDV